jgi:hypothetical protein
VSTTTRLPERRHGKEWCAGFFLGNGFFFFYTLMIYAGVWYGRDFEHWALDWEGGFRRWGITKCVYRLAGSLCLGDRQWMELRERFTTAVAILSCTEDVYKWNSTIKTTTRTTIESSKKLQFAVPGQQLSTTYARSGIHNYIFAQSDSSPGEPCVVMRSIWESYPQGRVDDTSFSSKR